MKNKGNSKIDIKIKLHVALKKTPQYFLEFHQEGFSPSQKRVKELSISPTEEHLKKEDSYLCLPMLAGNLGRLYLGFYRVIRLLEFCPKCFHQNLKIITAFK